MKTATRIQSMALALALATSVPAAAMEETTPAGATADELAEAKTLFETRCATCHGLTGKGDGAVSAVLKPTPRDLSDGEWQRSVSDAYLEEIILKGGMALQKSPLMPPNPDLESKRELLAAVREFVRSLRVDPPPPATTGSD